MRIFSDADLNVLYIEGVTQGPVDSFQFRRDIDTFSAFRPAQAIYEFVSLPWFQITDRFGQAFQSIDAVESYLERLVIPQFPLRFTVETPLLIEGDKVELDPQFLSSLNIIDGGFG